MPSQSPKDDDLLANAIPIPSDELDSDDEADDMQPIDLLDADEDGSDAESKIRKFERNLGPAHQWQRKTNADGTGATHMRTFVSKLRLDAMDHLEEQINTWLDQNPEFEVKFVTTTIGDLKGKITEPAMFMTVWV